MCEDAVELLLSSAQTLPLDQPIPLTAVISPDGGVADGGVRNDRKDISDGVLVYLPP
jgi:hypothetical protein